MTAAGLAPSPARQGPGRIPAETVERLELALLRRARGVLPGDHLAAGAGAGTELAQLRPYEAGDDVRRLDPAASARTGVPHVRLQVPERAITTWLVLDVSASMAFGTAERLKSDVAEGVAEVVARLAVRRGGRVGVIVAGGERVRLLPPRGGRGALAALRRLVQEGVAPDGTGPHGGLADALLRVTRLAGARGLVVVVSDFRDGVPAGLRAVAGTHSVVAVEVTDPREAALPGSGHLVLVDPETGDEVEADTDAAGLRAAYAAAEADRRERVREQLRRAGATHATLDAGADWLRQLARGIR
ncbi:MAG TPA: DUF58 domain-containing protein [Solirubrobacteraceae bacterium]